MKSATGCGIKNIHRHLAYRVRCHVKSVDRAAASEVADGAVRRDDAVDGKSEHRFTEGYRHGYRRVGPDPGLGAYSY